MTPEEELQALKDNRLNQEIADTKNQRPLGQGASFIVGLMDSTPIIGKGLAATTPFVVKAVKTLFDKKGFKENFEDALKEVEYWKNLNPTAANAGRAVGEGAQFMVGGSVANLITKNLPKLAKTAASIGTAGGIGGAQSISRAKSEGTTPDIIDIGKSTAGAAVGEGMGMGITALAKKALPYAVKLFARLPKGSTVDDANKLIETYLESPEWVQELKKNPELANANKEELSKFFKNTMATVRKTRQAAGRAIGEINPETGLPKKPVEGDSEFLMGLTGSESYRLPASMKGNKAAAIAQLSALKPMEDDIIALRAKNQNVYAGLPPRSKDMANITFFDLDKMAKMSREEKLALLKRNTLVPEGSTVKAKIFRRYNKAVENSKDQLQNIESIMRKPNVEGTTLERADSTLDKLTSIRNAKVEGLNADENKLLGDFFELSTGKSSSAKPLDWKKSVDVQNAAEALSPNKKSVGSIAKELIAKALQGSALGATVGGAGAGGILGYAASGSLLPAAGVAGAATITPVVAKILNQKFGPDIAEALIKAAGSEGIGTAGTAFQAATSLGGKAVANTLSNDEIRAKLKK